MPSIVGMRDWGETSSLRSWIVGLDGMVTSCVERPIAEEGLDTTTAPAIRSYQNHSGVGPVELVEHCGNQQKWWKGVQ